MKRSLTLVALTAALSLAALTCRAGETGNSPVASVPSTELAARSGEVIDRAIRALVAQEKDSQITRLWVFPTADANVVFVHYRTTRDADAHEPGPTTEHLVLLEMSGERIAKLHDLTQAPAAALVAGMPEKVTLTASGPTNERGL